MRAYNVMYTHVYYITMMTTDGHLVRIPVFRASGYARINHNTGPLKRWINSLFRIRWMRSWFLSIGLSNPRYYPPLVVNGPLFYNNYYHYIYETQIVLSTTCTRMHIIVDSRTPILYSYYYITLWTLTLQEYYCIYNN